MLKKYLTVLAASLLFFPCAAAAESNLNIYDQPRELPSTPITHESGKKLKMTDFQGDFVILVIWSRYCAPCVKELDNLQIFADKVKDDRIRVVLLSKTSEWNNLDEERRFLKKYDAAGLEIYNDDQGKLAENLGIFRFPNTVLINTKGQEIGRIRGSVEWDDPDVIDYIYKLKAQHG